MLSGISASPGIAIGKALLFKEESLVITKTAITSWESEFTKLEDALALSRKELEAVREITLNELGSEKAAIFESHLMLLEDPELMGQTKHKIKEEGLNVEFAFQEVVGTFIALFESMDDEYMRERAADIKDVSSRLLSHLLGKKVTDLSTINEEVILVTDDLSPSQTATMNKDKILGFLTNIGGKTSHSAIMARTLEIPAIVGLSTVTEKIQDGDLIVFDGEMGKVLINPTDDLVQEYQVKKEALLKTKSALQVLAGKPSETIDGHRVELAGNIGTPNDLEALAKNDAEAVGLYRTEFVFMDRATMPSEDEQFEAYSKVLQGMEGKNCIIRTLDIGGDKKLDYLHVGKEENPFLGYRAIRICLQDVELFKTQLRALLRASTYGSLGIMFPMISSLEELLASKEILEEVKEELREKEIKFDERVRVGMMIEVPSAAMMSDILADHVHFFSIGTNDLTQYTCAVDRMNEKIAHLYEPFNPGLLRLIHTTITNAKNKNIMAAMCGSMAHIPELIPFLLGSGLEEFSMSPMHILPTRKLIRQLRYSECQKTVDEVLKLGTAKEIKEYLGAWLRSQLS